MSIAVYLENSSMQIVEGTVNERKQTLTKVYDIAMPEGNMLNGVVTSEGGLTKAISDVWEKYSLSKKDVSLAVSGGQFLTKLVTIPKLNDKKMLDMVRREYSDLENPDNYLFDFRTQSENKKTKMADILCGAISKEVLETYVKVFQDAGIRITRVDAAMNCAMKAFTLTSNVLDTNYIMLDLDGNNLTTTVYLDGNMDYHNRSRIFSDMGTEDFATEIARGVSSVLQFYSGKDRDIKISQVSCGGFMEEDLEKSVPMIESLGLDVVNVALSAVVDAPGAGDMIRTGAMANKGLFFGDYACCIGLLYMLKKDMDFLSKTASSSKEKLERGPIFRFLPLIILLVVAILATGGLFEWNQFTQHKIQAANDYIDATDTQNQYAKVQEYTDQQTTLETQLSDLQNGRDAIDSYPKPSSTVEEKILESAGKKVDITILSYDSTTGVYGFLAEATDVTNIYNFIKDLDDSQLFAKLEYSGYGYTEDTKMYDIHVDGYLSESAGK